MGLEEKIKKKGKRGLGRGKGKKEGKRKEGKEKGKMEEKRGRGKGKMGVGKNGREKRQEGREKREWEKTTNKTVSEWLKKSQGTLKLTFLGYQNVPLYY